MSVDQLPTRPAKPAPGGAKLVQYDAYIDQQVESTRRVVKLVDLATSLVVMAAGVLAYLLVVAVAEHWIVPGGFPFAARVVLLGLLVCGVGYYAIRRIWPLLIGKINPVYAAQAIEQTGPSLKNSLVNLLLFRQKRSGISDAVYKTLEEQAAQRLSRVPVDAAVDRTLLIRFGYVLIAIVAVAGLYKVFSPKDPIVAAKRVLMPWANIVPASRVNIQDIEPGEATVSRGENLVVSAEVRGVGDDDSVVLKYTTRDGQSVDKPVRMKVAADGMRYEGRLPQEGGPSAEVGLAESLTYRIEAGDATSLDYAVTVVPTPTILVERIEYDYPEYTGYVDQPVENLADIRAIEGTRVTIHARANGPIADAHVDFDADGRRELPMTARETNAKASFVLELRDDRTTPKHASYVLRFMNDERRPNINPVKHSIAVDPDYAPEATILSPREEVLDVRLDQTVTIEVEARDPDFLIGDVRLHGEAAGRLVIEERLLKVAPQKRFASRYQFTPKAHNLRAGDTIQYWIAASDNKTPSPNTTLTKKQVLRIVSPDPAKQPPPDQLAQRDPQQRQQPDAQQGEQGGEHGEQGGKQSQDDAAGGQQQGGNRQQEEKGGQQQEGSEPEQRQGEGETGRQGDSKENPSEQQDQSSGESQAGGENAGKREEGEAGKQQQPGEQGGQSGEKGQSQGGGQPGGEGQSGGKQQQGKPNSNNKQTGAGAAGGEPSSGAQPDGTRPDSNQGGSSANGARSKTGQQPPDASAPPVSSEGDDDAEAFNRIQKQLEQDGELKDGESPSSDQVSRDAQRSEKQGQGDKETGRSGDTEKSESAGEAGERAKEGEGTKPQPEGEQLGEGQQQSAGAEQKPGAETKSGDPSQVKEQPGEKREENKSQGGEQSTTKGESGAGNEQRSQGAPNSQPEMKQGEKREQQGSQSEKSNEQEPPAGARGKKESDSQGEEGGDRAGGGEEGGGQKAPRDGTGSAGQNQSADEGGGESGEQGKGNVSSSPGQDSVANNQKGTPGGETKGRGRKQQPGEGEEPGGAEPGEPADGDQHQGTEAGKQAQDTGSNRGAPTGQGGNQGSEGAPAPRDGGTVPDGDKANLEYARQRTDLVLERLSDQLKRKRVDDKLLKQLGWSEEELRKFVERWEARKRAAEQNDATGESARRELDDALRSLGLRRGPMQQNRVQDDRMRDLKEGYRGPVPLEYRDRLKAYNQGVSRAGEDGE